MRTIITLKPAANGKVNVTRSTDATPAREMSKAAIEAELASLRMRAGTEVKTRRDALETALAEKHMRGEDALPKDEARIAWLIAEMRRLQPEGNYRQVQKLLAEYKELVGKSSDAKDLFIGTRGLSSRNEGFLDAAYDDELTTVRTSGPAEKGVKIPMPKDPKERAEYETGIARRKAAGGGKYVGDAAPRRRVIIHNYLPKRTNDIGGLKVGDDVTTPVGSGYILDAFEDGTYEVQLPDGRTKLFKYSDLRKTKDSTGPALNAQGQPVAYGKYQTTKMGMDLRHTGEGRDSYENGLHAKEDELIRKGYKKVASGSQGWTAYYENAAGKRVTIEFGPQPGQIRSISRSRDAAEVSFDKLLLLTSKEIDVDSSHDEIIEVAVENGATKAQAETIARKLGRSSKDAEHMVAGLTLTAFIKLTNKTAREMDGDSDYHEAFNIAESFGATKEQADEVARELGRTP